MKSQNEKSGRRHPPIINPVGHALLLNQKKHIQQERNHNDVLPHSEKRTEKEKGHEPDRPAVHHPGSNVRRRRPQQRHQRHERHLLLPRAGRRR